MKHLHSYSKFCSELENTRKFRKLPGMKYENASNYINFSTNDYLSLSRSNLLIEAAISAGEKYGVGSTGSRLLSGNNDLFEAFEKQIAFDKNTEASLIFNSGYQANISVLASLCDSKVLKNQALVFFDKLNHSSLYQAVFLSGARLIRYGHNNVEDLCGLLETYNNDPRPKFIVTETLFGMDGDVIDLQAIANLALKHEAFLYLDEAHALGILGANGYGAACNADLSQVPHLIMGTFSKAIGVFGAYIACSEQIKNYLINKCSGFIYSTSLSPMVVGASYKSWQLIKTFNQERNNLLKKADELRETLQHIGFDTAKSTTHIIPIILESEERTLKAQEKLKVNNIIVSCIRPPTVPPGSSRLRIALTVSHDDKDIEKLINSLRNL